jgi:hypothetical protein
MLRTRTAASDPVSFPCGDLDPTDALPNTEAAAGMASDVADAGRTASAPARPAVAVPSLLAVAALPAHPGALRGIGITARSA